MLQCCNVIWRKYATKVYSLPKSSKSSTIFSIDPESLIKKTVVSKNNPEKLSTTKLAEHVWCRYSISTIWVFNGIEDKHAVYRGEDCMKKFCEYLKEHAMKKNNFETKKMIPLTNKKQESYASQEICHICKKCWREVRHYTGTYRGAAHNTGNSEKFLWFFVIDGTMIFILS